jgi:hypothetical protein
LAESNPVTTGSAQFNIADSRFSIYPNPAEGIIFVNGNSAGETSISVFNLAGEEVKRISVNSFPQEVDLSSEPGGVYLLAIHDESGRKVFRIVKMDQD